MRKNSKQFIKEAKLISNGRDTFNKTTYVTKRIKVIITCVKHGDYLISPSQYLQGWRGCSKCTLEEKSKTTEKFISEAKQLNIELDSYEKVNYINAYTPIIIICKIHGDYESVPHDYIRGKARCNKCRHAQQSLNQLKTNEEFLLEAQTINQLNGCKDSFEKINYTHSEIKIIITCKSHGDYLIRPGDYLGGHRCPKCSRTISGKEQRWLNSFNNKNIKQQSVLNINGKQFKVDGYDSTTNTIYEFYGDFWHGNPKIYDPQDINKANKKTYGELYQKTMVKENIIINAGYNLISIWENDFINFERILKSNPSF